MQSPYDYDRNYQPHRAIGSSGSGAADFAMMLMNMGMAMNGGMGNGTFNSQFSNIQQLHSSRQNDIVYNEIIRNAAVQHQTQVGNALQGVVGGAMNLGGQSLSPQHLAALSNMGASSVNFMAPMAMQSSSTRVIADVLAGGDSMLNTAHAFGSTRKRYIDPLGLGPDLTANSVNEITAAVHQNLMGGSVAEQRSKMFGFHARDVAPVVEMLSSQGRMASMTLERNMLSSSAVQSAINSGAVTAADLKRMGVGDIEMMAAGGLDESVSQSALHKSVGGRQAAKISSTLEAMSAISDLLGPESGLIEGTGKLTAVMENFTRSYSQQLGGRRVGDLVRTTASVLKDFKYSFEDMVAMQSYVGDQANRFGYSGSATPIVQSLATTQMGGLSRMQAFGIESYGTSDADQTFRRSTHDALAYGKSDNARANATIVRRLEQVGAADTPEGRRIANIVRNQLAGAPTGDLEYDQADAMGRMAIASAGMVGSNNLERMMLESTYDFVNEKTTMDKNLLRSGLYEQRRDFIDRAGARVGASALGSLGGGPGGSDLVNSLTGTMMQTFLGMDGDMVADSKFSAGVMGQKLYDTLAAQAAAGDPAARAALDKLGSTPEEQQRAAIVMGGDFMTDISGVTGESLVDTNLRYGDKGIEAKLNEYDRQKVKGFVSKITAGSTNRSIKDTLYALSEYIQAGSGDGKFSSEEIAAALDSTFKTGAGEAEREQVAAAVERIDEISKSLELLPEDDGSNTAINQQRKRQQAMLDKETQFLKDHLQERIDKDAEVEASENEVSADGTPGASGKPGQVNSLSMSNVTLVFDDVTVQAGSGKGSKSTPNSTGNV